MYTTHKSEFISEKIYVIICRVLTPSNAKLIIGWFNQLGKIICSRFPFYYVVCTKSNATSYDKSIIWKHILIYSNLYIYGWSICESIEEMNCSKSVSFDICLVCARRKFSKANLYICHRLIDIFAFHILGEKWCFTMLKLFSTRSPWNTSGHEIAFLWITVKKLNVPNGNTNIFAFHISV